MNVEPQVCHKGACLCLGDVRDHWEQVVWLPYQNRRRVGRLASSGSLHQVDDKQQLPQLPCRGGAAAWLPLKLLTCCHQHRTESGRSHRSPQAAGLTLGAGANFHRKQKQGTLGDTGIYYTQFGIPELS